MNGTDRTIQILDAAMMLAEVHGYDTVTREQVAGKAGVSPTLVSSYFGTMRRLRTSIMRAAIRRHNHIILAQGLCRGDEIAKAAPTNQKIAAAQYIANV